MKLGLPIRRYKYFSVESTFGTHLHMTLSFIEACRTIYEQDYKGQKERVRASGIIRRWNKTSTSSCSERWRKHISLSAALEVHVKKSNCRVFAWQGRWASSAIARVVTWPLNPCCTYLPSNRVSSKSTRHGRSGDSVCWNTNSSSNDVSFPRKVTTEEVRWVLSTNHGCIPRSVARLTKGHENQQ